MAAIQRHTARQTLLQMQALRVAAWGSAEAAERFRAGLMGETIDDGDETGDQTAAALAAFGLRGAA